MRQLAADLELAANTVARACRELEQHGLGVDHRSAILAVDEALRVSAGRHLR